MNSSATIPPPPRQLTPRAARRSWNERPVRVCFILFVLVAATTGFVAVASFVRASAARKLVQEGQPVTATLAVAETSTVQGRMFDRTRLVGQTVELDYKLKDGREFKRVEGRITTDTGGSLTIGGPIEIRVDPADPKRWTDRTQPRSWATELSSAIMLFPLAVLLFVLMLMARARVLSLWRNGRVAEAVVVDASQSSIAPLSRTLRYALADGTDNRVFSTLCPADLVPAAGETITLIVAERNPGRAIVASLYA